MVRQEVPRASRCGHRPLGLVFCTSWQEYQGAESDSKGSRFPPCCCSCIHSTGMTRLTFFPFLCPESMHLHILEPDPPICSHNTRPSLRCLVILQGKQNCTDKSLASAPGGCTPSVQRLQLSRTEFLFQIWFYCVLRNKTDTWACLLILRDYLLFCQYHVYIVW